MQNKNIAQNGWTEYGRLVLDKLEKQEKDLKEFRKDMDDKLDKINATLTKIDVVEKDVAEVKVWKNVVNEIWSAGQMRDAQKEIYEQKNKWVKAYGIFIGVQLTVGVVLFFITKLI